MEPAKDLTIPCLSMKDSACIQTQLVCDLNEQGTAAALRPVFRGGLGWIPQAASFHWLIAPALVLLSATGAVPRGTGTQRNSSAAGRRRCPPHDPIHPGRLVGLLNPVAALFHCGHARRRGRAIRWVPAGPRRCTTGWSTSASVSRRDGQVRSSVAVFSPAGYRLWPSRLISLRNVLGFRLVPVPLFDGAAGF